MVKTKEYMRAYRSRGGLESIDAFFARHKYMTSADRAVLLSEGLNEQTLFQLYMEENDGYGRPSIISEEEGQRLIDDGYTAIYRGMPDTRNGTGREKLENVMYDEKYYTGTGIYGDGIYFTDYYPTAYSYAVQKKGSRGTMAAAFLKRNAKVADYDTLYREFEAYSKAKYGNEGPHGAFHVDAFLSIYARSNGYDAIRLYDGKSETYYTVLNRSALYMVDGLKDVNSGLRWEQNRENLWRWA